VAKEDKDGIWKDSPG